MRRALFLHYITSRRGTLLDICFILLLSLVPLLWFKGDGFLYSGDINFPLSGSEFFRNSWHTWTDGGLGRATVVDIPNLLPYGLLVFLCDAVGFSVTATQKLVWCLSFALCGLSMYFLVSAVVAGKHRRMMSLVAAVFYMLNVNALMELQPIPYFFYAALPLGLALYVKGLKGRRGIGYASVLCLVLLLCCTEAYTTVTFAVLSWAFLVSYLCFYLLTSGSRRERLHALKFTAAVGFIWVGLNAFWLIGLVFSGGGVISGAGLETIGQGWEDHFRMHSSTILDSMRLLGSWTLDQGFKGDPYFPWGSIYSSGGFLLVTVLVPLLAFAALLSGYRKNRHVLFFSLVALAGIWIIKGPHPPLGSWSMWFMRETHLIVPLRMVYEKIIPFVVLSYAFLVACTLSNTYGWIRARFTNPLSAAGRIARVASSGLILVCVIALIGVYAYPLLTGRVVYPARKVLPAAHVKIPDYYYEASEYVNGDTDNFRVLSLPMPLAYACAYWWNEGNDGCFAWSDPTVWLFSKPVIYAGTAGHGVAGVVANRIGERTDSGIGEVLALLNVKYVIVHNDIDWPLVMDSPFWDEGLTKETYAATADASPDLTLESSFGELDLYRNRKWDDLQVYPCGTATLVEGDVDTLIDAVGSATSAGAYFCTQDLDSEQIQLVRDYIVSAIDGVVPSVKVTKADSTTYHINITSATGPFFLVFSESFDEDWKAYAEVDGTVGSFEALVRRPLSAQSHLMVNGYANAWYIDPQDLGSDFTITLHYKAQSLFFLGVVISGVTLASCIGCTVWIWLRKRKGSKVEQAVS